MRGFVFAISQLWLWNSLSSVSSSSPSSSSPFTLDYDLQPVVWFECPENQQSEFVKECAEIILPLNRDNLTMGNVTGLVIWGVNILIVYHRICPKRVRH